MSTAQNLTADSFHFGFEPQGFICGVWIVLEDIHQILGHSSIFLGVITCPIYSLNSCQQESNTSEEIIFHDSWLSSLSRYRLGVKKLSSRVRQAVIWTANLIHAGGGEGDEQSQAHWSQLSHYYFDRCRYFSRMLSDWPDGSIAWRDPKPIQVLI